MASRTTVQLVDDLDESDADETIEFALDGVTYEIDLSDANAERLRDALAEFTEAARRTGGRLKPNAGKPQVKRTVLPPQRAPLTVEDRHALQRFAEANDLKRVAERGRVPEHVRQLWEEAGSPH